MVSSWKPLETYNYNKDEINQIAYSSKSNFLATADDSGDVKIIDTSQQCLYKTLRAVHTSICSSVQFLSWKPWAAITGGLDSKLAMWDFSKGRPSNVIDYGMPEVDSTVSCGNVGQCLNPAFVHSIAVPEMDMLPAPHKACAVARGDGVVDVINLESELATAKSKNSSQSKNFQSRSKKSGIQSANQATGQNLGKRIQLDYSLGGHTAAVSCVSFSLFGERGKFLISGGNDACVKLWDWSRHFCAEQTSCNNDLILNIDVKKKVNWLCTTTADSENLVVCDTSKVLKIYTVL
ncbi:putative WD repeat-containing protein 53 [Cocos nucifera]|uniref:Putative WD repeat-containing protein 53 n=1 Tax=Cocos nucifera TaxID=13894 RepID=A0A8K0HXE1_COCNU|nr:putative WD repeat-containing protein 53 [Cocos nucifera]